VQKKAFNWRYSDVNFAAHPLTPSPYIFLFLFRPRVLELDPSVCMYKTLYALFYFILFSLLSLMATFATKELRAVTAAVIPHHFSPLAISPDKVPLRVTSDNLARAIRYHGFSWKSLLSKRRRLSGLLPLSTRNVKEKLSGLQYVLFLRLVSFNTRRYTFGT